ncbi:MAG: PH domain-containing protein [Patescibacteria group bacterium]
MFHYSKFLREQEVLIAVIRRSWWGYAGPISVVFFLVFTTSLLSVPLLGGIAILKILFFILTAVTLWRVLVLWMSVRYEVLLITDRRIIDVDQKGLIHRTVTDALYDRITDITWSKMGVLETVTGCGGVLITTAGSTSAIEIRPVRDPKGVQELIRDVAEAYEAGNKIAQTLTA